MKELFEEYGSTIVTALFGSGLIVIFAKILAAVMKLGTGGMY